MEEPDPPCPPEIAVILLEILYHACLAIRIGGWAGEAQYCAIEADHVHNLPKLVDSYSGHNLENYWRVERPSYLAQMQAFPERRVMAYEPLWRRLDRLIQNLERERNDGLAR